MLIKQGLCSLLHQRNNLTEIWKLKNGKRLYKTDSFKYLDIQIEKSLTWKQQINHMTIKLNKTNAIFI